ncbi:hypothetical protein O181_030024 [Austropuccinia psidii MF-1]|uniref:DUF659 domain-containing protein n=1 Tax=Austropuccinia psidii MF-1 TaxID=1389203 RepID=A0A9Q3CTB1_9BASI|nr:hypothetical protein [Austropuccinia psidii MF-1]
MAHIKDQCRSISLSPKAQYPQSASNNTMVLDSEVKIMDCENDANSSTLSSTSKPPSLQLTILTKRSHSQISSALYFRPISKEKKNHLHELLLKALITANIPFRISDNPFFQKYQEEPVQSPFTLTNQHQITNILLHQLHADHEPSLLQDLAHQGNPTLFLDGWTDVSGNSIYAILLLQGQFFKTFVDILDLSYT